MGEEIIRVRLPEGNEVIGIVDEMLGGARFKVICRDGKERICRISGKFKRKQWIRQGDVVIVKPWDVQANERGNIIWKYRVSEIEWLKKNKFIE